MRTFHTVIFCLACMISVAQSGVFFESGRNDREIFIIGSLGIGALHNISRFSVELNADVYFFNLYGGVYSPYSQRMYFTCPVENQIWINPGVKLQYHFK